jgi:hypothetical protein
MEPAHWLIVYLVLAALCSLVASKKGRSGWQFFLALILLPVPLMMITSYSLGDDMAKKPFAMWLAAFICPAIGLIVALMSDSAEKAAVERGKFGDYKKCPFCAESVRCEALKCKHCHSELPTQVAT